MIIGWGNDMSSITQTATRRPDRRQPLLAGVLGLAAAVLIVVFLNNADSGKSSSTTDDVKVAVLVAAEPIQVGTKVSDNQLEVKQLPLAAVIQDAMKDKTQ